MAKPSGERGPRVIARNKRASRELHIEDRLEAGLVLRGTEIKSIRAGRVTIDQAYVAVDESGVHLVGANIAEYEKGSWTNHSPTRRRRLLLHKREIRKLRARVEERGYTILPLRLYLTPRGLAKLQIGVGRGKKLHDKRQDLKKRDTDREIQRALKGER